MPKRQLVRQAAVERDEAAVVGPDEVDLPRQRVRGREHRRRRRATTATSTRQRHRRRALGRARRPPALAAAARRQRGATPARPRRRRSSRRRRPPSRGARLHLGRVTCPAIVRRPRRASVRLAVGSSSPSPSPSRNRTTVMLSLPPLWLAARTSDSAASSSDRRGAQDRGQLLVGDHARQAVGADQEDVAGAARERVGVDLDVRLGPERARDDRALRVVLGGLGRDLPAALELGHQRVVARELLELAVAQPVGAAVADVAEADLVAGHLGRGHGRAHARGATSSVTARS